MLKKNIETGVDRLIALINEEKEISLSDAAKTLRVSEELLEEWANFLEEGGIITIEYKFAKPFLKQRNIPAKEAEEKKKQFGIQKDTFIKRVSTAYSHLVAQKDDIDKIKDDFDALREGVGPRLGKIKKDVFGAFGKKKEGGEEKLLKKHLKEFEDDFTEQEKRYKKLMQQIGKEEEKIKLSQKEEQAILKKLGGAKSNLGEVKERIKGGKKTSNAALDNLAQFRKKLEVLKADLGAKEEKIVMIIQKIGKGKEGFSEVNETKKEKVNLKGASAKLKRIMNSKDRVVVLLNHIEEDTSNLENELKDLMKQAKIIKVSSKDVDAEKHMHLLVKVFESAKKKKESLKKEISELGKLVK